MVFISLFYYKTIFFFIIFSTIHTYTIQNGGEDMNINCTSKCYYQKDGKCRLNEIPAKSSSTMINEKKEQCPYFQHTQKK